MSRPRRTLELSLAALATFVAQPPLPAQPIPLGAEQPQNEVTAGSDSNPAIGVSDNGDLLVVWVRSSDGDSLGLFGRHTPAGDPIEDEFPVNAFIDGPQVGADLDMNAGREFAVVWTSFNQAGKDSASDLVARRSTVDGTILEEEFVVGENVLDSTSQGAVASDAEDGFVAAWHNGDDTIAALQFDGAGVAASQVEVAAGTVNMRLPDVGVDSQRGFVVVWQDADADGSGIWGRIYEEFGANPSAIFRVNSDETTSQQDPRVAMAANGEFVVVWTEHPTPKIEGRRFKADGTPVGGDFPISPSDGTAHFAPDVDGHADGSFVVVWTRTTPSTGPDSEGGNVPTRSYSREYQRTAQPVDGAFAETAQPGIDAQSAPVVGVGGKLWTMAWSAPDIAGFGIYARSYLRRAVFADDFEGEALEAVWSAVVE